MILYHGGTEAVMHPDCKAGRPDLDFGQGFYMTSLLDQAEGFARRKARDRKSQPVISVYEFDYDAAIQDCAYLNFEFYDEAWLDFVIASRNGLKPWAEHQPNHQICILNQAALDKYLKFVKEIEL